MIALVTLRLIIFAILTLVSFIVLGILINFQALSGGIVVEPAYPLGIAVSAITILVIPSVLAIDRLRKGALMSLVWFELAWVGVIWVLWLATAASMTAIGTIGSCVYAYQDASSSYDGSICSQFHVVQAFSWVLLFTGLGWFLTLLIASVIAYSRGYTDVYMTGVVDHPMFVSKSTLEAWTTSPRLTVPMLAGYPDGSAPAPGPSLPYHSNTPRQNPTRQYSYPGQGVYVDPHAVNDSRLSLSGGPA